jgi:hypothetical protein
MLLESESIRPPDTGKLVSLHSHMHYPDELRDAGEAPPSRKLAAQSGWNLGEVRPQVDTTVLHLQWCFRFRTP